ncbi:siphovirus ReqiPepy6 Gp37-like family protein [Kineococcus esterisolvens]|uniref:siphovirus ReqiPepy6 Gp37-like family protein n=1 Tax=unclassified Kineococcus TaxID=2621656 RepID=UPI003D7EE9A7
MRLDDLTIEVRDKQLRRRGLILPHELDFQVTGEFNNVTSWTMKLPVEHPLADDLRSPGAGIIVTTPQDVLFSGPVIKPEWASTVTDPGGTVTYEGVDDTVLLADALALPDPTNPDLAKQTLAHDIREGTVEDIMHGFVRANIGPGAPAARREGNFFQYVVNGPSLGRGPVTKKSARFPVLGDLLAELAITASLGFRIVQRGAQLVFETFETRDLSRRIRLDVYNNTLSAQKVAQSGPGVTRVLVAGQGELTDRAFLYAYNDASVAGEAEWGRRVERFVDQRQTDDPDEYKQAAEEALAEDGFSAVTAQAVPMEDSAMEYGRDWAMGDIVTVVVEGRELQALVSGYAIKADREGFRLGAVLGDTSAFDDQTALQKRVGRVENRVSALERNTELTNIATKTVETAMVMQMMGAW